MRFNWNITINVSNDLEIDTNLNNKTANEVVDYIRKTYPQATSAVMVVSF
jgi:hypothetical protein